MNFYKILIRPLLFKIDPERVHHLLIFILRIPGLSKILSTIYKCNSNQLSRSVFGLTFSNPVGLAAGFDKNAQIVDQLGDLGFGFVEIGTVTPRPQPGNDRPRIFRLKKDSALINRMGFNNDGLAKVRKRLTRSGAGVIVGGNIGKNKVTPNEEAWHDYQLGFEQLYDVVDYFVVNVSSPNTPGLRELQEKEPLTRILANLQKHNAQKPERKPILLKIAPDLTNSQLDEIISIVLETKIDGIIATNTTITRNNLTTESAVISSIGDGGLSGKPLTERSTEVIRYISTKSNHKIPVIGVGGIHSPQDALNKLAAGACLIQLYTGFIYEGPALIKRIKQNLISETR